MKKILIAIFILLFAGSGWGDTLTECHVISDLCFCDYSADATCAADDAGSSDTWISTYPTFTLLVATETLAAGDVVDGDGNTFRETWTLDGGGSDGSPVTTQNAKIYGSTEVSGFTEVEEEINYGYESTSSDDSEYNSWAYGWAVDVAADGDLVSYSVYLNTASGNIKMALYTDNAGEADAYIANSGTASTAAASDQWNVLTPLGSVPLTAGRYWIFLQGSATTVVEWTAQVGQSTTEYFTKTYADAWPANTGGTSTHHVAGYQSRFITVSSAVANIWEATAANPGGEIWFIDGDGTVHWGNEESALVDVDAEYDWFYDTTVIQVYSTTDPDSAYASIEASTRQYGLYSSGKDYVVIDNIEIAYTYYTNLFLRDTTGSIVRSNEIHHCGPGLDAGSHNLVLYNGTNVTISKNEVYEGGEHGIFVQANDGNISNVIIEYNKSYNNNHSNLDLQNSGTGGTYAGAIVRYNEFYNTSAYQPGQACMGMYVGNSAGNITGLAIYDNVFGNARGTQIQITVWGSFDVTAPLIYNNTFYGQLSTFYSNCIYFQQEDTATITSPVVYNNLFVNPHDYLIAIDEDTLAGTPIIDYNTYYNSIDSAKYVFVGGVDVYGVGDYAAYTAATGYDVNSTWAVLPSFTDAGNGDLTLKNGAAACNGALPISGYNTRIDPTSTWPDDVRTMGSTEEIGAYGCYKGARLQ